MIHGSYRNTYVVARLPATAPQQWVELFSTLNERVRLDNQPHATDEHLYLRKLLIEGRHIEDRMRHVAEQRIRMLRLHRHGLHTRGAERLFGDFEGILREMFHHAQ